MPELRVSLCLNQQIIDDDGGGQRILQIWRRCAAPGYDFKVVGIAQVETLQRNKLLYCVIDDLHMSTASNSALKIEL
jgi:hypothetical protein